MTINSLDIIRQVPVRVKGYDQVKVRKVMSFEEAGTDTQIAKFLKTKDLNIKAEIEAQRNYYLTQNVVLEAFESQTEIKKFIEIDGKQENTPSIKHSSTVHSLEI